MARKSLKASPEGIDKAKKALTGKAWSHDELARQIEITRTPVSNFFNGKGVDPKIFVNICEKLGLDWEEITGQIPSEEPRVYVDIEALTQEVRKKIEPDIKERCSTMRVLDMTQPIELDGIYTSVNILEKITGRIRVSSIEELIENVSAENFDRISLGGIREKRVPVLEAVAKYSKLMILGKPGAGKTTFLKHLAYSCIKGRFQENRIPLFITLKDFAEEPDQPNLLRYLIQIFLKCDFKNNTNTDINPIEQLLKQGRLLILMDGLDEVRKDDSARVLKLIQNFTNDYLTNQFVITCRIAAREYTFEQFTEVEIADFNDEQIQCFGDKWFTAKEDKVKAGKFFRNLQDDKPIRELATNPLLLTLLCLVFEESGEFPKNRSELYKEGLDVLLKKWDIKSNIERDQIYKKLSLKRKEDLLSQIAYSTFEQGQYFFKQKDIEERIIKYICNLPNCSEDPEVLQIDSEAVLKSIEAQHGLFVERARGIYSFCHLTFQEYFTAREIFINAGNKKFLDDFSTHVTEARWREVFLLTVGMLKSADWLLQSMKEQVDSLLATDKKLWQFLAWIKQKSETIEAAYKPPAIRALYLSLSLDLSRTFDLFLSLSFSRTLDSDRTLDLDFSLFRTLDFSLSKNLDRTLSLSIDFDRTLSLSLDKNGELHRSLQELKNQLQNFQTDEEAHKLWWQENGHTWAEKLRAVMIKHRNIGHDWQFTELQKELLKKYYDANKFLIDCLNSDCYVSRDIRQEIENTLLLPIKNDPDAESV